MRRPIAVSAQLSPTSQVVKLPPVSWDRQIVSNRSTVQPGNKIADGANVRGGGGPENMGAQSEQSVALPFYEARPSWSGEDLLLSEYGGPARPSTTPNMAGIPANNFRFLGDNHGGRA